MFCPLTSKLHALGTSASCRVGLVPMLSFSVCYISRAGVEYSIKMYHLPKGAVVITEWEPGMKLGRDGFQVPTGSCVLWKLGAKKK